jgi:DNA-binding CsgD family transcriptional regulator
MVASINLRHPPLTRPEQDALLCTARGLTKAETALCLRIAERTVHYRLRRVKDKLGATNLPNMVHLAHIAGLLGADW